MEGFACLVEGFDRVGESGRFRIAGDGFHLQVCLPDGFPEGGFVVCLCDSVERGCLERGVENLQKRILSICCHGTYILNFT